MLPHTALTADTRTVKERKSKDEYDVSCVLVGCSLYKCYDKI